MRKRDFLKKLVLTIVIVGTLSQSVLGQPVPGRFICKVDNSQDARLVGRGVAQATGGTVGYVYDTLNAFLISVPPGLTIANLRARPALVNVEQDFMVHTCAQQVPTGVDRIDAEISGIVDCSSTGIAIIDSGIDLDHPDLNVMAEGIRFFVRGRSLRSDNRYDDDYGHGTHCAGIAAAIDNDTGIVGVAPNARVCAIKVLDSRGSGYMSAIAAGVDWLNKNAEELGITIANMSLGGQGQSQSLMDLMAASPVTFTVSAGNESDDIDGDGVVPSNDDYIPAAYGLKLSNVLTISALADSDGIPGALGGSTSYGPDDSFATFSNFSAGDGIAYILPGVDIYSTYLGEGYATMSGTSMAAPHAAGLLALEEAGALIDWTGSNPVQNDPDGILEPLPAIQQTGDLPPTVSIANPADGDTFESGELISFTGSAGDTEDGDLTSSIVWTSDSQQIGTGGSFSAVLSDGDHLITAEVTDSAGNTASDSITITIGSTPSDDPPTVSITSPADGDTFESGELISFTGSAGDTEDGDLTSSIVWTSDGQQIGTGGSFSAVLSDGDHVITAEVTDSAGNTASDSITVTVRTTSTEETVEIILAEYKIRAKRLTVEATSSLGGAATLIVDGYGPMTYDPATGTHVYASKVSTDPGPGVTVVSQESGVCATASVDRK